ncbi:PREDICTED: probable polygalacturonase [Populus euphratica]|uniref:Probable polygalacturonase n=1 Tax=Populus euphratica TaxID=75702 RepID=A0AAJ6UU20_POPEU|nr:PREDICTED: probable polygalacturonase [Populus euphratica]
MGFFSKYRKYQVLQIIISTVFILGSSLAGSTLAEYHQNTVEYKAINCRKHSAVLTDFGAVGDGKTSNTKAFEEAIKKLSKYAPDGGAQLIVPAGKWLTGSFNLTSHFTLFLHKDAVLLASQDEDEWPLLTPLPSYGGVRENAAFGRPGGLIFASNVTDVIITGNNGTVDGQGAVWWEKFTEKKLKKLERPYLIEIMYSDQVQISNITLINSPQWHVHPIYSSNLWIQGVTILAPVDVPNTDGINPDSCTNVIIEDCYIVSGDDCIAVKSGLDQYGIKVGMPMKQLVIRRITCISPKSAAIALGSEMSGGIEDVRVEDITAINTESAVRVKTAVGRGGYVKDIFVRRMTLKTMKYVFWMIGSYSSHADEGYDPKALPEITNINFRDIVADNVTIPGKLEGLGEGNPFTGICISNVTMTLAEKHKEPAWNCTDVSGVSSNVTPMPCAALPKKSMDCPFPEDQLPIEKVRLQTCSATS